MMAYVHQLKGGCGEDGCITKDSKMAEIEDKDRRTVPRDRIQ